MTVNSTPLNVRLSPSRIRVFGKMRVLGHSPPNIGPTIAAFAVSSRTIVSITPCGAMIGTAATPGHEPLEIFIGKWMTAGETVATEDVPAVKILASDVYEWMPGGFFILHTAHGRIGEQDVGGTEIIGFDAAAKVYGRTSSTARAA
jgi:hypothetical protein